MPHFFDQLEILFRIETFHDDRGAAHPNRQIDGGLWRRMIERRGRQVDHAFAVLPELLQEIEQRQLLRRRHLLQRPQDALGPAGGARRIEHRGAVTFIGDRTFPGPGARRSDPRWSDRETEDGRAPYRRARLPDRTRPVIAGAGGSATSGTNRRRRASGPGCPPPGGPAPARSSATRGWPRPRRGRSRGLRTRLRLGRVPRRLEPGRRAREHPPHGRLTGSDHRAAAGGGLFTRYACSPDTRELLAEEGASSTTASD